MSLRVREIIKRAGISGTIFITGLFLSLIFYVAGHGFLAALAFFLLIPFGAWFGFRVLRLIRRHSLWSLRNRLLLVYTLLGALPFLLFITLVGLGAWALMNELAIYLASSALDRKLGDINDAVETLKRYPVEKRELAVPEIWKAFENALPGITFQFRDSKGEHRFPENSPEIKVPSEWKTVRGLLVANGRFYGWSRDVGDQGPIDAFVPLTNEMVQNLVPNLGEIALVETHERDRAKRTPVAVGSLMVTNKKNPGDPDFSWTVDDTRTGHRVSRLPAPVSRLDLPVFIPSTRPHYHLDTPGKTFAGVLWVESRPSAVLRTFFSGSEAIRDVLTDALIAVAILFCIVELIAIWIGVSLSRRITGAVNQLYEGTRRVIHGDFRHRIPVRDQDQLGELAQSFNRMTGNLERLLSVEKEKERLQTELEIAREVQSQLYPKEAPPTCGLKLTVRCDPARMVSGDYYDYAQIAKGKLAFAIGDVAGKGISAALLMATLQAALRAQITSYSPERENECTTKPEVDAALLVSKLNRQIYAHTAPEKYATFFCSI